ncbi:hypothetical protein PsorP6_014303 [Peronosclerospora sorghi]|uniref:Uncharacterized protein n=1 Tax=Peronosclerospora sorghi TaxID=230839 RepID=A0ACC0VI32_9STRA|nr:hypothetical protein PsorP6_014303 [Peronosclerospora sorghi]
MDREHTPQKQRQKRKTNLHQALTSSTSHASHETGSHGTKPSFARPVRACRSAPRPRHSTTGASPSPPASILSKAPPSMIPRGAPVGSTGGILYEPDAPPAPPRRVMRLQEREKHVDTYSKRQGTCRTGKIAPPPSTCIKLITSHLHFATDLATHLGPWFDRTHFTVVGVLGFDGVGKSTVLSRLAAAQDDNDTVFATRSVDAIVHDRHETTGIDLALSTRGGAGHPLVLLDSQPMCSSSILASVVMDRTTDASSSRGSATLAPDHHVDATSYQLAVFLVSICHYVVIVHDNLAFQGSIHALLRKLVLRVAQCRVPSVSGTSDPHVARLLYVVNHMAEAELLYRERELWTAHERALETAWPHAFVRVSEQGIQSRASSRHATKLATFVLPPRRPLTSAPKHAPRPGASPTSMDFDDAVADLQRFVWSLPSAASFTSPAAATARARPPHALSLREWLSNASRVFEGVRKASCFTAEYMASRDNH